MANMAKCADVSPDVVRLVLVKCSSLMSRGISNSGQNLVVDGEDAGCSSYIFAYLQG